MAVAAEGHLPHLGGDLVVGAGELHRVHPLGEGKQLGQVTEWTVAGDDDPAGEVELERGLEGVSADEPLLLAVPPLALQGRPQHPLGHRVAEQPLHVYEQVDRVRVLFQHVEQAPARHPGVVDLVVGPVRSSSPVTVYDLQWVAANPLDG